MTNPATSNTRGRWTPIAVLCLALLAIASSSIGTADAKKHKNDGETLCYDVVIAGAGASGATLAGKLARAGVSVLLLEAGENTQYEPSVALMQGFFGTYNSRSNNIGLSSDSTYMWPNYIVGDSGRYGVKTPPGSGKGLGGGSSVFMANFHTGGKLMWSAFGPEWDWDTRMSPIFDEIINSDIQPYRNPVKPVISQLHLKAMRREADEQYALGELDYLVNPENFAAGPNVENPDPAAPPLNHNDLAGVNSVAAFAQFDFFSNKLADGTFIRKAPANTYLGPDCLHLNGTGVAPLCPKLRVLTGAYVSRVLFDTDRATGRPVAKAVEFVHEGAVKVASANVEVVVSAGSFQSPAVLQRSGLGDAAYLAQLGIPLVANITQVGRNLKNHFSLLMAVRVTGDACAISDLLSDAMVTGGNMGFNGGAMLTYSKYDPNRPDNTTAHRKTQFMLTTFGGILPKYISVPYKVGPANQSFTLAIDDIRFAAKGYVQIPSSDPFAFPKVFFNTFVDYANAALNGDAFWNAARKGVEPTISGLLNYRIGYRWVMAANAVLADEGNAARLEVAFPTMADLAFLDEAVEFYGVDAWWKYLFPDRIITANSTPHEVAFVAVLARLLNELRDKGAYVDSHQCGTNQIGAVVDGRLRVNGVDRLRVVDASIMPLQSGGNTGGAAVAIGFHASQFILEDIAAAAAAAA